MAHRNSLKQSLVNMVYQIMLCLITVITLELHRIRQHNSHNCTQQPQLVCANQNIHFPVQQPYKNTYPSAASGWPLVISCGCRNQETTLKELVRFCGSWSTLEAQKIFRIQFVLPTAYFGGDLMKNAVLYLQNNKHS